MKSNLKNIAQNKIKIISNNTWHLLTICPKPTGQITNSFIVEKGYVLYRRQHQYKLIKTPRNLVIYSSHKNAHRKKCIRRVLFKYFRTWKSRAEYKVSLIRLTCRMLLKQQSVSKLFLLFFQNLKYNVYTRKLRKRGLQLKKALVLCSLHATAIKQAWQWHMLVSSRTRKNPTNNLDIHIPQHSV